MDKTSQPKQIVAWEQEYPGASRWPIYEVKCPSCKKWASEYGNVDELQPNGANIGCFAKNAEMSNMGFSKGRKPND